MLLFLLLRIRTIIFLTRNMLLIRLNLTILTTIRINLRVHLLGTRLRYRLLIFLQVRVFSLYLLNFELDGLETVGGGFVVHLYIIQKGE